MAGSNHLAERHDNPFKELTKCLIALLGHSVNFARSVDTLLFQ